MRFAKCLKFISGQKAQTTLEYFIILAVVVLLTFAFLAPTGILQTIKEKLIGSDNPAVTNASFFGQAIQKIRVGY